MKLWLDAHREPDVDWVWAKTAHCAIVMLRGGCVDKISLAPDQRPMINEVLDWMIANDARALRTVHKTGDGVRYPRGLLRVNYPPAASQ